MPEIKRLVTGLKSSERDLQDKFTLSCLSMTSDKVYTDNGRDSADANYFLPKWRALVTLLQNNYL